MFEIGEYIVYGSKGVCRIDDITHLDISGADNDRLYYVLTPIGDVNGKIYAPTDNQKVVMRRVISQEEARQLIRELPGIELLWVPDEKQREGKYKEALRACDYHAWVSIVKTLYLRKKERTAQGKKITVLDEKYMRAAENELYSELSVALEIPKEQMEDYIREQLQMA
ncbi:MAG: CarD family transcriptional regulator [Roseburia sp.]